MRLTIILAAVVLLSGCANEPSVTLRDRLFKVELAADDASRAKGLMFRDVLGEDQGMLFLFPDQQSRSFWMHNCKIALDILYFDQDRKLVSQSLSVPPCNLAPERCPNYPSLKPAKYVLELNAGVSEKLGVRIGDELVFHQIKVATK
jgi:uncharacterized protein